ncbi:tumor necrosis factor receptor superfamily member 9-like [Heptranchias perlo]|uniref:tumor necrosis factor receptor superfamily member 9-like n=1 Tax=Heptranchias perlo TaxID=212740 RepID=UPI0035594EDD
MEFGACWMVSALLVLSGSGVCSPAVSTDCPQHSATVPRGGNSPCCSKCRPGTFMEVECTATSYSVCVPCPTRSYSEQWNTMFSCFLCIECIEEGMKYKKNCTTVSNAQCECSEGYVCEDRDCKSCVLIGEDVENIPCSTGTYSDTGTEPCELWTNCTALGHFELTPGNQTSDAICKHSTELCCSQEGSTIQVGGTTVIVTFISLCLLCLSVGMHIVIWRKNKRKEFNLLPTETSPWHLKSQTEDTCSMHFPEQECGGTSHQEKKSPSKSVMLL